MIGDHRAPSAFPERGDQLLPAFHAPGLDRETFTGERRQQELVVEFGILHDQQAQRARIPGAIGRRGKQFGLGSRIWMPGLYGFRTVVPPFARMRSRENRVVCLQLRRLPPI